MEGITTTNRELDLGVVQQKSTTIKVISMQPKPVLAVRTSCGCTTARAKDNQMVVTYKAPDFPKHLSILGKTMMEAQKTITVVYKGGEKEIITLKATIVP